MRACVNSASMVPGEFYFSYISTSTIFYMPFTDLLTFYFLSPTVCAAPGTMKTRLPVSLSPLVLIYISYYFNSNKTDLLTLYFVSTSSSFLHSDSVRKSPGKYIYFFIYSSRTANLHQIHANFRNFLPLTMHRSVYPS